jgi:divalent metal cation (Fe/Co/Zn/Cd) transporter
MERKLINTALLLAIITVVYNVIEGAVSVYFGLEDETIALLGFGVDSFVEVISGLGILHMILRMRYSRVEKRDNFERTALRVTGVSFYLLTAGLLAGAVINLVSDARPDSTIVGIIVSSFSIATMYFLMHYKLVIGKKLGSDAIIADAHCTRTCFYLSIILLVSSLGWELFSIPYIDEIGSLGIAWFAFREGREAFEKASSENLSCCGDDCHS